MKATLSDLVKISTAVGMREDYVQGGGGNTSVKLDDTRMAIKASGFRLKQITQDNGYVMLDYDRLLRYYSAVDLSSDIDFEADNKRNTNECIISGGAAGLRPSVEAGFHSRLKSCVIHTHSVYANILCCSVEGRQIAEKLFADIPFIFVPYVDPGFMLSLKITEAITDFQEKTTRFPEVVFMQNHGLIVSSDDANACIALHETVNDRIRNHFNLNAAYPKSRVGASLHSETDYIKEFFTRHSVETVQNKILYPDQLVYLNSAIGDKFFLEELRYEGDAASAQIMEETLLAWAFVADSIEKAGLTLTMMTPEQIAFITGWESEAYRKQLAQKGKV